MDSLIPPVVDALSGQPESKHAPVRVDRWPVCWQAEIFLRDAAPPPPGVYWSRVTQRQATHFIMAGQQPVTEWAAWLQQHFGLEG
ncbi:Uncharacterised protein [Serratia rubidaea]|uniref:Uncharacterized protein n=1 Tax=Serratia rubidaea TaxID=61652 RepID=A0A4U9HNG5_SERRU|nr:Uncharacterised protein [Serratia rubidaea]